MQTATHLAETLNPERLAALRDASEPSSLREYARLQRQLTAVLSLDHSLEWIALLAVHPDGNGHQLLIRLSRHGTSTATPEWLDPECLNACKSAWGADHGRIGKTLSEDGRSLIMGCAAITQRHERLPSFIVQVGTDASSITRQALSSTIVPGLICALLAGGIGLVFFVRHRIANSGARSLNRIAICDTVIAAYTGICLTALVSYAIMRHNQYHDEKDFINLARSYELRTLESFVHVRDMGTQAIAALIVASDEVNADEFAYFSRLLQYFRGATAWAWAEPVAGEDLAAFEESIRQRNGASDFHTWEKDDSGVRVAVTPGDLHLPLVLVAPQQAIERVRGMDMRSRPFSQSVLQQAMEERMPVASPLIPLVHTDHLEPGIIVYHPVFSPHAPDHLLGFAIAAVPATVISNTMLSRSPAVRMDLFVEDDNMDWALIGSSDIDEPPPMTLPDHRSRIRPLLVLGNTYAIRTRPVEKTFVAAIAGPAWIAMLSGLAITFCSAFIIAMIGRRRIEDTAKQEALRLRLLFQNIPSIAVQGFMPDGTVVYWNKASETLYGFTADEAIGANLIDLIIPPEMADAIHSDIRQMVETKQAVPGSELGFRRKDGSKIQVYCSQVLIDIPGQPPQLYALDVDMTEINHARQSLELLAHALDAAANGVVITNNEGIIEWVNAAFCKTSGFTQEESIGRRTGDLLKSGKHDAAFYGRLWQTILAGQVWSGEIINKKKNGTLYPEEVTITPVKSSKGDIHHFIAIKRDLTEDKANEERILRTQRMESIGTLAGGIAHDINNALTPILMILDSIRSAPDAPSREPLLKIIESSVERSAGMISQLLTFARGADGERINLNLKHIVGETEKLLCETFPKSITVKVSVADDLLPVHGDATQIHQVLLNLCVNARDAMPDGGTLSVTVENTISSPLKNVIAPQPMVKITVRDTGCGISAEVRDRIFDPFFTTKEVGKGSGLGLSTTHSIIKGHGGFIEVSSQPGKGTKFELFLPATNNDPTETMNPAPNEPIDDLDQKTILVVDDESAMRQTLEMVLVGLGFTVILAADGAEALEIFRQNPDAIDLVITDMAMPVMDGHTAVRAMREIRPDLPVIGTSGMSSHEETDPDIAHFISKPYKPEELLKLIKVALAI